LVQCLRTADRKMGLPDPSWECQCAAEAVLRDVQHCERCGERLVPCSGWVEVHGGVEAALDTSSDGILGVVGHTPVAAGIDVDDVDDAAAADAAEALAVRADAAQGIASTRAEAASTNLDDSCTEAAAETFAHSP
jgi:hypothetical protein